MMELNSFQFVGALAMPPHAVTTQQGTRILELLLENYETDGYNGAPPKMSYVQFNLAGDTRQYENLRPGQMILVSGRLDGQMATSTNGGQFCRIKAKAQTVTILPSFREVQMAATPGMQMATQQPYGGFGG